MKILLLDSGCGLIPFIKEIINMDKKNTYYLFMDNEFFPYGNKSKWQLKKRLKYLLKEFEVLGIDMLLICCNTMSKIYEISKIKTTFKVKTILSLNLSHLGNAAILVTPSLKKLFLKDERFISCNLAKSIENENFIELIEEIKSFNFQKNIILGCTHYPLVKALFKHYAPFKTFSYENEFIAKIKQGESMAFYGREYECEIFKKYFPNINIFSYYLS